MVKQENIAKGRGPYITPVESVAACDRTISDTQICFAIWHSIGTRFEALIHVFRIHHLEVSPVIACSD